MLVKFSGHNFSSFLPCPGGPVRLRGKEGRGERSRREPAGTAAPGPAAPGPRPPQQTVRGTHHVARHRQCRRAMERPEDMAMAGSLAETIFACHTSRLGTLNALSGAGRGGGRGARRRGGGGEGKGRGGGGGGDGGGSPRRPYMRGAPLARRPARTEERRLSAHR